MKSFKRSKKKGEGGFALSRFLRKKRCVPNLFILALTRKSFRDLFLGSEQHWRRQDIFARVFFAFNKVLVFY